MDKRCWEIGKKSLQPEEKVRIRYVNSFVTLGNGYVGQQNGLR